MNVVAPEWKKNKLYNETETTWVENKLNREPNHAGVTEKVKSLNDKIQSPDNSNPSNKSRSFKVIFSSFIDNIVAFFKRLFGIKSAESQLSPQDLLQLQIQNLTFLSTYIYDNGYNATGIFRISGSHKAIKEIIALMDKKALTDDDLANYKFYDIADALKQKLKNMNMFGKYLSEDKIAVCDSILNAKPLAVKFLCSLSSEENNLFKKILDLCIKIDGWKETNKMNLYNLSLIFSPAVVDFVQDPQKNMELLGNAGIFFTALVENRKDQWN